MTKAELIKRHGIDWYNAYKASSNQKHKEQYKSDVEFRTHVREYSKNRYRNDSEYRAAKLEHKKEYQKDRIKNDPNFKEYYKEYKLADLNSDGKTKDNIRRQSSYILFDKRKHTRFKEYEIHHCFGYDDPSKFIYIPKSLHYKIHQYLRDNNIDADSNHYDYIKYMINECEEYTYISI
jgi:hypothetical protein